MRKTSIIRMVLPVVAVCLCVVSAKADPYVYIDIDNVKLVYTDAGSGTGGTATITQMNGAVLKGYLKDDSSLPNPTDDTVTISAGSLFDLNITLTLARLAAENWTAAGPVTLTETGPGATKLKASFTSSMVEIDEFGEGATLDLKIQGSLNVFGANDAILLDYDNDGTEPWVFKGDGDEFSDYGVDQDGVANQISVANRQSYDGGRLVTLHFQLSNDGSLDTLFANSFQVLGGDVDLTITPVPPAVVLGFVGLAIVGWRMRRYA